MDDVHRFQISTPFSVGRVNCYAFTDDGLTLLDPGPSSETAYEELAAGLDDLGFAVADTEQVLITHPHMDHFGLANRVVEESGATAVAHRDATGRLGDPLGNYEREKELFRPYLQTMGMPAEMAATAVTLTDAFTEYQEALAVDRELTDGDSVDAGVDLRAVHTPGHVPGSVCFVSAADRVAFTGDHVLRDISPNPLLTVSLEDETERTRSLPNYLDSLHKLREVEAEVGYGGHGGTIEDLDGRIQEILDHHDHRKETIAGMIDEMGSATAFDIMEEMFPDIAATEFFPAMCEVIGHLDLLEDEARVDITEEGGVRRYSLR